MGQPCPSRQRQHLAGLGSAWYWSAVQARVGEQRRRCKGLFGRCASPHQRAICHLFSRPGWSDRPSATAVLMDRFYENLLQRRLACDEAPREAQSYTRDITIAQLRSAWLSPDTIATLAAGDANARREY